MGKIHRKDRKESFIKKRDPTEEGKVIRKDKKESFKKKMNTTEEGKVIRKDKKESLERKGTQQKRVKFSGKIREFCKKKEYNRRG